MILPTFGMSLAIHSWERGRREKGTLIDYETDTGTGGRRGPVCLPRVTASGLKLRRDVPPQNKKFHFPESPLSDFEFGQ